MAIENNTKGYLVSEKWLRKVEQRLDELERSAFSSKQNSLFHLIRTGKITSDWERVNSLPFPKQRDGNGSWQQDPSAYTAENPEPEPEPDNDNDDSIKIWRCSAELSLPGNSVAGVFVYEFAKKKPAICSKDCKLIYRGAYWERFKEYAIRFGSTVAKIVITPAGATGEVDIGEEVPVSVSAPLLKSDEEIEANTGVLIAPNENGEWFIIAATCSE